MSYLPQVVGARHISGFIVSVRFDDGTRSTSMFLNGSKGRSLNLSRIRSFLRNSSSKGTPLGQGADMLLKPLRRRDDSKKYVNKSIARMRKRRRYILDGSAGVVSPLEVSAVV